MDKEVYRADDVRWGLIRVYKVSKVVHIVSMGLVVTHFPVPKTCAQKVQVP